MSPLDRRPHSGVWPQPKPRGIPAPMRWSQLRWLPSLLLESSDVPRIARSSRPPSARSRTASFRLSLLRGGRSDELQALLHFGDGGLLTHVLVLDHGRECVILPLHELQHRSNRRVALPPRLILTVVPLAVFQVQMRDAIVVFPNERDRVVVATDEVADVEVGLELPGHPEQPREAVE